MNAKRMGILPAHAGKWHCKLRASSLVEHRRTVMRIGWIKFGAGGLPQEATIAHRDT